jgi:hypothetical protein
MTAARPKPFTQGATSERLAQYILGNLSFVTPVPYPEDVGHDFHCVLYIAPEGDNRLVHAGPAFAVQVKSNRKALEYTKDYERKWIGEQANPFFLCVVNRARLAFEIYSTWNVLNGVLYHGTGKHPGQDYSPSKTTKVVLRPGILAGTHVDRNSEHPYGEISLSDNGTLTIPLGPPVLSLNPEMVKEPGQARVWAKILGEWIDLDRANIIRVSNGMYWVYGPRYWETNKPAWSSGLVTERIYWNVNNFYEDAGYPYRPTVAENFVRSADALRRVVEQFDTQNGSCPLSQSQRGVLDVVLQLYEPFMNTMANRLPDRTGQRSTAGNEF